MISILIPNYNYDCQNLVQVLIEEIKELDTPIEIIIADDASTNSQLLQIYNEIQQSEYVRILKNDDNYGREKTRSILAKNAKFNYLLFLDADVLPKQNNFIKNFIDVILKQNDAQVIFGGIAYAAKPKNPDLWLRWLYGKVNEEKSLTTRKKDKYRSIVTGAICIQKNLFLKYNTLLIDLYGLDITLAYQFKKAKLNVIHIENPVLHFGLESNATFLQKTKEAWKSVILLENKGLISRDFKKVQQVYLNIEKIGLANFFKSLFKLSQVSLEKNISGKNPKLFLFTIYRMLYFCYLKKTNSIKNEAT